MSKLVQSVKQFMNDEEGVTAVEYALIVALIGAAIITAWGVLGTGIETAFNNISTKLSS